MTLAEEVEQAVNRAVLPLNEKLGRMEKLVTQFLVRRPTQKQMAKRLGVHPVTLSRRKKRAENAARLAGTY